MARVVCIKRNTLPPHELALDICCYNYSSATPPGNGWTMVASLLDSSSMKFAMQSHVRSYYDVENSNRIIGSLEKVDDSF